MSFYFTLRLRKLSLILVANFEEMRNEWCCMQIEDGCKLGSADEIATTVHQIFEQINGELMWSNLSRT